MGIQSRTRRFNMVAAGVAVVLAVTLVGQAPGLPAAAGRPRPPKPAQVTRPVPVNPHVGVPSSVDATAGHTLKAASPVVWPAGVADVAPSPRARAGTLPVWVTRPTRPDRRAPDGVGAELAGLAAVRVEVLDRMTTARARVAGMLLRLTRTDGGSGSDRAGVEVDYSGFRHAYGGDWAGRLRLSVLPECALFTPDAAGCQAVPLLTRNDPAVGRLSADLDVAPATAKSAGTLVALAAGSSSSVGDFKATDLSASATWTAGGSAGNFTWSYPMRVPPSLGGPSPQVGLSYSTQSVDGRTAAANSQPSWVGEGFDLWPGYIERSYKPCQEDGVANVGDQCWGGDNATMALGGGGGELIQDGTSGVWRPKNDDGSRVEKLTGAVNGDQGNGIAPAGEYWKVTTLDGTEYFFGLNRLPGWASGQPETKSAWTTAVFGNNTGEPCNQSIFAASSCTQAYRWNLDYVVDRHGNTMSFWYSTESNNYSRNLTDTAVSSYVRGGWLTEAKYGTRQNAGADSVFTTSAPMKVVFGPTDRCITAGATCTSSNPTNWPDVPWDQNCTSSTNCAGKYAPTFWTTKKLSTITTQVWGGSAYRNVDRWTLTHEFKQPAPGEQGILWLKNLVHTGLVGGSTSLPALTFNPDPNATYNRVATGGTTTLHRYRMSTIDNETGGTLSIGYSLRECSATNLPTAAHTNTKRCFPVMWVRPGQTSPTVEYFHKYVVTSVVASDRLGGNPPDTTTYTYLTSPAWHYDESEFTPASRKTWGQWRGYEKVRVTRGQTPGVLTTTDQQYFRGMDEDFQPGGAVRDVKITDSDGVQLDDSNWRAGQLRETLSYKDVATNTVAAKHKADPWQHGPTATRNRNGVIVHAYVVNAAQTIDKVALDGGRGWRTTRTANSFDTTGAPVTGLPTQVDNRGDETTTADDQCTRYEYARNDPEWMRSYLTRVWTAGVNCATTPNLATQVLSDVRTYYDGATSYGATIDKGNKTREEQRADWVSGAPVYTQMSRATYDGNGRTLEAFDPLDRRTATAYTPASGNPVTAITVTNPMTWTATSTIEPAWGLATRTVDVNTRATDLTYDSLGRLTAVWLPGRVKGTDSANATFTYDVRTTGTNPTAVTTARLNKNGGYVRSVTLYDGHLNPRQTQATAPDGGAIIVDTLRDSRGLAIKNSEPYYTNLAVATTLVIPQTEPPGQTQTVYDTLERPTTAIFKKNGAEKWRTSYGYGGDRVDIAPPAGATPISTITDARGNTTDLRQYHGASPTGTYDATRYTHTARGDVATLTDPANNIWRYTYDQRGRKIGAEDPDAGTSTYSYDNAGQLLSTTDGRNQTLVNTYDALGRRSQLRETSTTGPLLAEWTYDTLLNGQPSTATRYSGGNSYTSRVTAWDAAYRPLTTQIVIPSAETGLAGTYEWTNTYNIDGTIATQTLPAAGGLAAETLTFGYGDVGLPTTLSGLTSYITATGYSGIGQLGSITATAGGNEVGQYWFWEEGTGRLAEQLSFDATAGTVYQDLYYGYDEAGNVKQIDDKIVQYGFGPDETQCFRYDRLRRLTDAWTPATVDCTTNPTVAALGGPARYWHTYTYDVTGNRRTEIQHTAGGDTTRTYTYPAAGGTRPHTLNTVGTVGPGVNRTDTYTYDTAGNTTSRPGTTAAQTLTWNSEERLASSTENSQTTTYLYDADGNRLIRRDPTGSTLYLPGMELFKPTSGTATCTRYYTHAGQTVAVRNSTGLHWQVADHHGTSNISLSAATMAKTQRRSLPFGGARGTSPTWPTQKGFVGGTNDPSTGTTHLGAREYDPALGRFISDDPVTDFTVPQQIHGYSYANNAPLTLSDPDGLDPGGGQACDNGHCSSTWGTGGGSSSGGTASTPAVAATTCTSHKSCERQAEKGSSGAGIGGINGCRSASACEHAAHYSWDGSFGPGWLNCTGVVRDVTIACRQVRAANLRNGSTDTALQLAANAGIQCEYGRYQIVCFGMSSSFLGTNNAGGQPITVGDVLFMPLSKQEFQDQLNLEADRRNKLTAAGIDGSVYGPDIEEHERVHSVQWSAYDDTKAYAAAYWKESYDSARAFKNPWLGNRFEVEANLFHGGYLHVNVPCSGGTWSCKQS